MTNGISADSTDRQIHAAAQLKRAGLTSEAGVAGPASRTSLIKYAMMRGIGASIRALKERPAARGMMAGDTPEQLLSEVDEHTRTGVLA
jgi:methylenetetrahydrofolate reductase (NADPH)